MTDLRERVRRTILLGMGGMLKASPKAQTDYLALLARAENGAPSGLEDDTRLTVDAVIAEVVTGIREASLGGYAQAPLPSRDAVAQAMPDPTPAMLNDDPLFDAIWDAIKGWDVGVPGAYSGYCGALGNHARAIYDRVQAVQSAPLTPTGERMRAALQRAAEQFESYAAQHRAKNTKEGDQKAETNDQMAALCRAAMGPA